MNYTEGMSSDQKDRSIEYLIEQNENRKFDCFLIGFSPFDQIKKDKQYTNN